MGALFLYVTCEFFLAIRGGPYMTPLFLFLAVHHDFATIGTMALWMIMFDPIDFGGIQQCPLMLAMTGLRPFFLANFVD